jgi:ABC-type nickel/cobalt efflux system permease component RcnA
MTLAPHSRSTAADLLRLVAVWLAAIVLMQGIAAAQALGHGPLHRHADSTAQHERQHHGVAERHHHAADVSVLPAGQDPDFNAAAFALTAALALMALGHPRFAADARRHVWRAALPWAWRAFTPALLLRPPKPS